MKFLVKSLLVGAAFCCMAVSAAKAEIFVVEDQNDRFSLSFPDLWEMSGNQKADDKLTVVAPGQNDLASCRVRVREDRRFVIYPSEFSKEVQHVAFSRDFWNDYLSEYDDVTVDFFKDDAGVGRGFASMVEASYTTAESAIAHKRGLMFAALYNDRVYVVECSAEKSSYQKWRADFMGVVKSVDFTKTIHETTNGHYRNLNGDAPVIIQGKEPSGTYKF